MLHNKTGDINSQAQTQRLCGSQHRRVGEMEGDVDCCSAWMSGTLGKGCLSLVGFPGVHLQALGRLLRRCVEPEQVTAMSSFPLRPLENLVGRQKENGQEGGKRKTASTLGMVHRAKARCAEGKGYLLNASHMLGHSCVSFLRNFLPTSLMAEYFYSHCTEEDTEAGAGTGYDLTTKSGVFAGHLGGWVLKYDPPFRDSQHHSQAWASSISSSGQQGEAVLHLAGEIGSRGWDWA